jgi:hypothetical protein
MEPGFSFHPQSSDYEHGGVANHPVTTHRTLIGRLTGFERATQYSRRQPSTWMLRRTGSFAFAFVVVTAPVRPYGPMSASAETKDPSGGTTGRVKLYGRMGWMGARAEYSLDGEELPLPLVLCRGRVIVRSKDRAIFLALSARFFDQNYWAAGLLRSRRKADDLLAL